jgi:hypothetical protein
MQIGDHVQVVGASYGPDVCYPQGRYGVNISGPTRIGDIIGSRGHVINFGRVNVDFTVLVEMDLPIVRYWFCPSTLTAVTTLDLLAEI